MHAGMLVLRIGVNHNLQIDGKIRSYLMLTLVCILCWSSPIWASSPSIPRSTNSRHALSQQSYDDEDGLYIPPWNPSKRIGDDGFLTHLYRCVPGDWEEEASVGGRYSDLRKKSRFLFGLSQSLPSSGAPGRSIPFGGSSVRTRPLSEDILSHPRLSAIRDDIEEQSDFLMCRIRQVPGDGNCLFHSVSTCLSMAENGTHVDMRNTTQLRLSSAWLRQQAVDCLRRRPRRVLFLQGRECLRAQELVEAAAAQYSISADEYCDLMSQDSYWGGGPEIVALCNVLRRPIHVYELACVPRGYGGSSKSGHCEREGEQFVLRRMACFGSPKFDRKEPLHILSADSRFPDISPGRQLASGNHFLALFPYSSSRNGKSMRRG